MPIARQLSMSPPLMLPPAGRRCEAIPREARSATRPTRHGNATLARRHCRGTLWSPTRQPPTGPRTPPPPPPAPQPTATAHTRGHNQPGPPRPPPVRPGLSRHSLGPKPVCLLLPAIPSPTPRRPPAENTGRPECRPPRPSFPSHNGKERGNSPRSSPLPLPRPPSAAGHSQPGPIPGGERAQGECPQSALPLSLPLP